MMKKLLMCLIVVFGLISTQSFAQENSTDSTKVDGKPYYLVKKTDGSEFYGYILSDDGREILLETKKIGKIYINKSDILEIIEIEKSEVVESSELYGDFRTSGIFTTRYYLTTNALPIKKKENYSMIHLYGPEVHFAVTDNLSLGIMATWIASPIALAAKYSFNSNSKTHIAIGSIVGSSGYLYNASGFGGLHWLTVTQGGRKSNVSLSAGYGYLKTGRSRGYGNRYNYQTQRSWDSYYVEPAANQAVNDLLVAENGSYDFWIREKPLNKALVVGLSAITPVGKKSSFIFDSMVFFSKPKELVFQDKDINVTYFDYNTSTNVSSMFTIGEGSVQDGSRIMTTVLFMPGMRFNQSYDKAFQVTLSGLINFDGKGDVQTVPFPMVSWLRQF